MIAFGVGTQGTEIDDRVLALPGPFVVLHPDAGILSQMVGKKVLVRWYDPPMLEKDPEVLGRDAARWWKALPNNIRPNVEMVLDNELNLWYEFGVPFEQQWAIETVEGYRTIGDWKKRACKAFRDEAPACRLHFGPWAPGHKEDGPDNTPWGWFECLEAHDLCQVEDIHGYWEPDGRGLRDELSWWASAFRIFRPIGYKNDFQPDKAIYPDPGGFYWIGTHLRKPIWITEFNQVLTPTARDNIIYFQQRLAQLDSIHNRIEAAVWFLGQTFNGSGHEAFDIVRNDVSLLDLFNNPGEIQPPWAPDEEEPEEAQMLKDQFPAEYAEWLSAGGDPQESFGLYLMGTGRLAATAEDFVTLCERMKSHLEEIKQIGLRLKA